ncbi:c-type cytochrome biogenesis protein CcsB [Nonomuraea guangzhouensis]|uniref:C-type cytochrome biogenesis protein CcsB n=1 Tax=Nonomuraea guangzhouensis TaxID=1291555 RepID=A0ABW4GPF8_9ACTN|nr:c-type cytochrome biogenesis protein CcsB [Nonomuraea guangzhouensis]
MPAEQQLAGVSDLFIVAAVLLYLAAMIGFALELAFGRSQAGSAAVPARQPVGAGVGSSGGPVDAPAAPVAVEPPNWVPRAGWLAMALGWLGWAANLGAIVTRGLAVDRWPWGNMYEFVVAICFAAVTAFLGTQLRQNVRFLGAFVMVTAALGLGFAVKVLYTAAGPVVPALNSYWVAIHVTAAILASGLFVLAGVSGILYLIRGDGVSRLPSRADLERVAHRAIVFAFPVWTFAVIAGALWADKAWGRYWGWDPKEVWAFITWVAYAAYLHARVTAGWRGRAATIVQLVAFGCLLFNLVGVNMFISGLHSYSGL